MGAVFSSSNVGKEIMELHPANGADINHGSPIVMDASRYAKNAALLEFLLSNGARANVQDSHGGETSLNLAIPSGNKEAVQALLRHQPDLGLKGGNYGSALATAVQAGRLDMALLIQNHSLEHNSNSLALIQPARQQKS